MKRVFLVSAEVVFLVRANSEQEVGDYLKENDLKHAVEAKLGIYGPNSMGINSPEEMEKEVMGSAQAGCLIEVGQELNS